LIPIKGIYIVSGKDVELERIEPGFDGKPKDERERDDQKRRLGPSDCFHSKSMPICVPALWIRHRSGLASAFVLPTTLTVNLILLVALVAIMGCFFWTGQTSR
jgi:hypothetical protein